MAVSLSSTLFGGQMSARDEERYRYGTSEERNYIEQEYQRRWMERECASQYNAAGHQNMHGLNQVAPQKPMETTPAFLSNPKLLLT